MMDKVSNDMMRAAVRETERPFAVSESQKSSGVAQELQDSGAKAAHAPERVEQTVMRMNEYLREIRRDLNFSVDDDSGRVVVKVINTETNEVIRQIPSEEALELAERLRNHDDGGLFVSERA